MIVKEAQLLAEQLLKQYGLSDYHFEFDEAVSRFGYCCESKKLISLSRQLTEMNALEAVRNTILHEIAHALTPHQNHNEVWQRVCKAIGGNGQRCYDNNETETPLTKYTAHCPNCSKDVQYNRKRKRLFCGTCYKANNKRFNEEFKFKWIKNT